MSRDVHTCSHCMRPPPAFGLIYEGRYWSAKIDDISFYCNHPPFVFLKETRNIWPLVEAGGWCYNPQCPCPLRPPQYSAVQAQSTGQKKVVIAESIAIVALNVIHKVHIHLESVPSLELGTPPPTPSPASESVSPPPPGNKGGRGHNHLPVREWGVPIPTTWEKA